MDPVDRHDLQQLLATGQPVRLAIVLGPRRFTQAHIPGSETFADPDQALNDLEPVEPIIVCCSGPACQARAWAQRLLTARGYRNVCRFVGGLEDWDAAGLPLATTSGHEPVAA